MSKWIGEIDGGRTTTPVNIREAINLIGEAWEYVSQQKIYNCWKKTGILPRPTENHMIDDDCLR